MPQVERGWGRASLRNEWPGGSLDSSLLTGYFLAISGTQLITKYDAEHSPEPRYVNGSVSSADGCARKLANIPGENQ